MSRVRWMVMMVMAAVAVSPADSAAQTGVPQVRAQRSNDAFVVSMEAGTLRATQTLSQRGFDLRLVDGADTVRVTGGVEGRVLVARGAQRRTLSMRTATAGDAQAIARLLDGSRAVRSFDLAIERHGINGRRSLAVFVSAAGLLGAVRGRSDSLTALVVRMDAPQATLHTVAQRGGPGGRLDGPDSCWGTYVRDVIKYTYDWEHCMRDSARGLNPIRTVWCIYEYEIKASLAAVWVLDCHGIG